VDVKYVWLTRVYFMMFYIIMLVSKKLFLFLILVLSKYKFKVHSSKRLQFSTV